MTSLSVHFRQPSTTLLTEALVSRIDNMHWHPQRGHYLYSVIAALRPLF